MGLRAAALAAMALAATAPLAGCGSRVAIVLHDGSVADAKLSAGVSPNSVARTRRRRSVPAEGVVIDATLWDGALIAAGIERGRTRGDDEALLGERRQRWVSDYVAKKTSFTVVIELANRSAQPADDPLTTAEAWRFTLERGDGQPQAPASVELQAVDRFPTQAGGNHVRLGFAVIFKGDAWTPSGEAQRLRLRVQSEQSHPGLKRRELGMMVAKRGAQLSWWVAHPS